MTKLQEDIIGIYNDLVKFSKDTVQAPFPIPIKVRFEKDGSFLIFEQRGNSVSLYQPIYYCLGLDKIKPTILLPEDYDVLMYNLKAAIDSGKLLNDRTCLCPTEFGFDIYSTDPQELSKGPELISSCKFISSNKWLFRFLSKLRGLC